MELSTLLSAPLAEENERNALESGALAKGSGNQFFMRPSSFALIGKQRPEKRPTHEHAKASKPSGNRTVVERIIAQTRRLHKTRCGHAHNLTAAQTHGSLGKTHLHAHEAARNEFLRSLNAVLLEHKTNSSALQASPVKKSFLMKNGYLVGLNNSTTVPSIAGCPAAHRLRFSVVTLAISDSASRVRKAW